MREHVRPSHVDLSGWSHVSGDLWQINLHTTRWRLIDRWKDSRRRDRLDCRRLHNASLALAFLSNWIHEHSSVHQVSLIWSCCPPVFCCLLYVWFNDKNRIKAFNVVLDSGFSLVSLHPDVWPELHVTERINVDQQKGGANPVSLNTHTHTHRWLTVRRKWVVYCD